MYTQLLWMRDEHTQKGTACCTHSHRDRLMDIHTLGQIDVHLAIWTVWCTRSRIGIDQCQHIWTAVGHINVHLAISTAWSTRSNWNSLIYIKALWQLDVHTVIRTAWCIHSIGTAQCTQSHRDKFIYKQPLFSLLFTQPMGQLEIRTTRTRAQTEQQKEMLTGGHKLLSEYFQSCDRKQRNDVATDELLCSNLLFRFSGLAGDEYMFIMGQRTNDGFYVSRDELTWWDNPVWGVLPVLAGSKA